MTAVLLFSALVHVGALALAVAYLLPAWHGAADELDSPGMAKLAGTFGLFVGFVAAVLMRFTHPFGQALAAGIVAGMLAAVMLALFTQIRPTAPALSGAGWHTRPQVLVFYGTFALLEILAACLLAATLTGGVPR